MFYFILIVLILVDVFSAIETPLRTNRHLRRKKPFAAFLFSTSPNTVPSDKSSCNWLKRAKPQNRICRLHPELSDILLFAKDLAISSCQRHFEFEQWNCSQRSFFFKDIYRETALMYSLASSAVMYSVATTCSKKNSHNFKYAKKITRKIFQFNKRQDAFNAIVKYNTELGIQVALANKKKHCKCHGVSGSCSVKVCCYRIESFEEIASQLRHLYHRALQVQAGNNFMGFLKVRRGSELLYMEQSPSFCSKSSGRLCNSKENCATICCGEDVLPVTLVRRCNCEFRSNIFNVTCDTCREDRSLFRCK